MKRIFFVALVLAVFAHPAFGAFDAYMQIKGQGWDGPAKLKLIDFNSKAITSVEKTTGKFNGGHRKWEPIVLTRAADASSPKLMQWCASGKHIVTISAYQTGGSGKAELYYTITLTNATISYHKTGGNNPQESMSLNFTKIEWTWVKGGITATDDWEART